MEVDGPDHFSRNAPHTLLGSTAAKHSCLQARGWAVLSIPFHEWNSITAALINNAAAGSRDIPQQQQQWSGQGSFGGDFEGDDYDADDQQQQQLVRRRQLRRPQQAPAAAAAAAGTPGVSPGMLLAAESVGVPADCAGELAAARADYLKSALDRAVQLAEVPRSILY